MIIRRSIHQTRVELITCVFLHVGCEQQYHYVQLKSNMSNTSKDMITYEQNYLFSYLHKLGLAQDRCGMKVDFLLPVAGKQGGLLIDIDQVWIHACHQGCLHHSPVLRVQIDITDITAPTGTDKT